MEAQIDIPDAFIELWQDIPGYEGYYQISNTGIVKTLGRKKGFIHAKTKDLTPWEDKKGYLHVGLRNKDGKKKNYQLHRLVAGVFVPNPDNKPQVNHIDGNKHNNRASNLEWVTNYENHIHKVYTLGVNSVAKIKPILCVETGVVYNSVHNAARSLNSAQSFSQIAAVARGERKTALGYHWRYVDGN